MKNRLKSSPGGVENRGKSWSGGVFGGLGASWGVLGGCGAILEGFFGDIGAKMGATWAKLEPSWRQVAPKMGHVSAKMAMLASFWVALGRFWEHFWSTWADALDIKKPLKTLGFLRFLVVLGWLDGVVWASWRLFWAMLAPRWRCLVDVGAMLRQVGGKLATKSAKMRQHRRKWGPRFPQVFASVFRLTRGRRGPCKD